MLSHGNFLIFSAYPMSSASDSLKCVSPIGALCNCVLLRVSGSLLPRCVLWVTVDHVLSTAESKQQKWFLAIFQIYSTTWRSATHHRNRLLGACRCGWYFWMRHGYIRGHLMKQEAVEMFFLFLYHNTIAGKKPFACDLCEKCFADNSKLKNHKRAIHEGMLDCFSFVISLLLFFTNSWSWLMPCGEALAKNIIRSLI